MKTSWRHWERPPHGRHFTGEPFGNDAWFYIGQRVSYYAFLKPDVIEQRVLAVLFDGGN